MKLPKKIVPCPIADAVIEFRFNPIDPDILPGFLVQKLKLNSVVVEKLPVLQIPETVRETDPQLRYTPLFRILSPKGAIQIGPRVLAVSAARPYGGWSEFRDNALSSLNMAGLRDLVHSVERFGIRYINVFGGKIWDKFDINVEAPRSKEMQQRSFSVRTELVDGDFLTTIQMVSDVDIVVDGKPSKGSVLDIDTCCTDGKRLLDWNFEDLVNQGHEVEKRIFFSLLKKDFLETLSPEYSSLLLSRSSKISPYGYTFVRVNSP